MGKLHKTTGYYTGAFTSNKFNVWRVYLDPTHHWARITIRKEKPFRMAGFISVYDIELTDQMLFDDKNDMDILLSEIDKVLESQKRLYPREFKEQKSHAIKEINYQRKNWPNIFEKPKVVERLRTLLPFLRKRK